MAFLQLIANTTWGQAVQVRVTDGGDALTADTEPAQNIVGGPSHLSFTQSGTAERRWVYINKAGALSFDTVIVTNMNRHNTHGVQIRSWNPYPATPTTHYTSNNFAEVLVGINSTDWIYQLAAQSSKQGAGLVLYAGAGGAYSAKVNQVYFGTAFTFNRNPSPIVINPVWQSVVRNRQRYLVQDRVSFSVINMTRAELDSLQKIYRIEEEPFFLYDADGIRLSGKLWHCVLGSMQASPTFDNLYDVQFIVFRLRPVV